MHVYNVPTSFDLVTEHIWYCSDDVCRMEFYERVKFEDIKMSEVIKKPAENVKKECDPGLFSVVGKSFFYETAEESEVWQKFTQKKAFNFFV